MLVRNIVFYLFSLTFCIHPIFSADPEEAGNSIIKGKLKLKYEEIKKKERKIQILIPKSHINTEELKIKKLENEIHQDRIEIIKLQTKMLPSIDQGLGEQIKDFTGMILVVAFTSEQPSIVGKLSATILQDKNILTSAHALLPLLKESSQPQKFRLFFIPNPYSPPKEPQRIQRNYEAKILRAIQEKENTFGKLDSVAQHVLQKQMFSGSKATFLTQHAEGVYKEGKFSFRFKLERKFTEYNIFAIKDLIFPGKTHSSYDSVLSNTSTDIAIGLLAHTEVLPKSPFILKKFSSFDQEIGLIKQTKKNLFVASWSDYDYFFSGGEYPVGINSVEVLKDKTLRIPIPQALGCSGGALMIAPEVNDPLIKDMVTPSSYKSDHIEILGVVRGRDDEGNNPSMGLYSTWNP